MENNTPWWQSLDYDLPPTDLSVKRRQGGKGEDFPFRVLVDALEHGKPAPKTSIPRGTPNHQGLYRSQLALYGETRQAADFLAWQLTGGGWCLTEPFAPYLDFHTGYVTAMLVAADLHGVRQLREYCLEWLRWTRYLLAIFRAPDGRVIAPHPRAKRPYHYDTTDLLACVLNDIPPPPALAAKIQRTGWFSNGRWSGWSARMLVKHQHLWHPLGERKLHISTRRQLYRWHGKRPGGMLDSIPANWGAVANPIIDFEGEVLVGDEVRKSSGSLMPVANRRPGNPLEALLADPKTDRLEATVAGVVVPLDELPVGEVITFSILPGRETHLWDWRHQFLPPFRGPAMPWQFNAPTELTLWVDEQPHELRVVEEGEEP